MLNHIRDGVQSAEDAVPSCRVGVRTIGAMVGVVAGPLATAAAKAVAARAATKLGGSIGSRLERRSEQAALARCTEVAFEAMSVAEGRVVREHEVSLSFFHLEAADELAKALVPGHDIDPRRLASLCVASLTPRLGDDLKRSREAALLGAFQAFSDAFIAGLWADEALAGLRQRKVVASVSDPRVALPTATDELRYLRWLIDKHRSIRTVGMVKSHAIDIPLDDVFVGLAAHRDGRPGDRAKQWFDEERKRLEASHAAGELDAVGFEARLDRLARQLAGCTSIAEEGVSVDLGTIIAGSSKVLIMGDPGCGKTTLLRHLVLGTATRRLDELARGEAAAGMFPVFARIGDFARWDEGDRGRGLSAFIAPYVESQDCDVPDLDNLIKRHLEAGRCLVLLDGLDEVASAQERQWVVDAITSFVDAYSRAGNRFVVTSRISGYLAAPLPAAFDAYRVEPMDEKTIGRFLDAYCPAIERFYAPETGEDIVRGQAGRAAEELRTAFTRSPGIRRLAANPLLLTTLIIVHWVTGRLPRRRADAYVEITDALAGRWRRAGGVPESALPDERLLKQWLTRLGGWLHENRPEGSASWRELVEVLGPLWAKNDGTDWDPTIIEQADCLSSPAGRGIEDIVRKADEHTGLLVERAPERYGFPHLTFEEYYAGRALVFEGKLAERASRIRARLHDPRYHEPILLALGLLAREQPEEVEDLISTAIHGEVVEPSPYEDLLGRDFLFALRVLADDVPISNTSIDRLLQQRSLS
jgi:hypothetical protein